MYPICVFDEYVAYRDWHPESSYGGQYNGKLMIKELNKKETRNQPLLRLIKSTLNEKPEKYIDWKSDSIQQKIL